MLAGCLPTVLSKLLHTVCCCVRVLVANFTLHAPASSHCGMFRMAPKVHRGQKVKPWQAATSLLCLHSALNSARNKMQEQQTSLCAKDTALHACKLCRQRSHLLALTPICKLSVRKDEDLLFKTNSSLCKISGNHAHITDC
ncbi:hypothetical protein COO60DRAFT_1552798 [Scenedesmus sp. NREL 46B-D3]|nr:hypothetical protein COO60DRAFT_1552798 [Scenedesmus sp. NREL 46B-D3]